MAQSKTCPFCGDEFRGVGQKRYCSKICKERARYDKHRDSRVERQLKRDWAKSPEVYCWNAARERCKKSGLPFTITVEDIPQMPKSCPITGLELCRNEGGWKDNSPTLDRVDNTKGYIPGNVRIISFRANRWKSSMPPEIIKRLYEYSIGKI